MNHAEHDRRLDDPWRNQMRDDLLENTRITNELRTKLNEHIERTKGVTDAWETIEAGVRVLGWIGRAGEWLISKWKPILIIGVAIRVLTHGGSVAEAWAMLAKIFKSGD